MEDRIFIGQEVGEKLAGLLVHAAISDRDTKAVRLLMDCWSDIDWPRLIAEIEIEMMVNQPLALMDRRAA